MVVDNKGFRLNVGIILSNKERQVFWGRRIGHDAWQFPQGGVNEHETLKQAMFRELYEELGLEPHDVKVLGVTDSWLRYRLPNQYIRRNNSPTVIGQKQKWFLLQLVTSEQKLRLDLSQTPEFDSWRWVDYWHPLNDVIYFKKHVYQRALSELEQYLLPKPHETNSE